MGSMLENTLGKFLTFENPLPNPMGLVQPLLSNVHLQRTYMWEIILPMVGIMPGVLLCPLCQSVSFGDYTFERDQTTRFGAFEAKYPGMLKVNEFSMTFLKAIPDIATTYFTLWRKLIVSSTGLYSPKSTYAKTIYLIFLDTTGIPVNRYKLTGVFPLDLPSYQLDYVTEEVTKVKITFSVDKIETLY
jgi:hypothetical protein